MIDEKIDTVILLMSSYVYPDVSRVNYNEKSNTLVRTFKNPEYHVAAERVTYVNFLKVGEEGQKHVILGQLEKKSQKAEEKAKDRRAELTQIRIDDPEGIKKEKKLAQTENRIARIQDTLEYGRLLNQSGVKFASIGSDREALEKNVDRNGNRNKRIKKR